jgi:predicted amidohydrolase YtcJ
MSLLLHDVEVVPGVRVDVRVEGGMVSAIRTDLTPRSGERVVDGRGGALLPGLHDHHIHLLALGAAATSVVTGPIEAVAPALRGADDALPEGAWLRAVGYDEPQGPTSGGNELDRAALDAVVPDRPVRVQGRTGHLWVLNGAALRAIGLGDHPNGRFIDQDDWLRSRLPPASLPDLGPVAGELARAGVTGVTDATPAPDADALNAALQAGAVRQRVVSMACRVAPGTGVDAGPIKLLPSDEAPPAVEDLGAEITAVHETGRPVAVHCASRVSLVTTLAAIDDSGARAGDRIEHAAVAPPECVASLARLGLTVVTQPHFIAERGDRYLTDVDPDDVRWLYRLRGHLDAGVAIAAGTDAPVGRADPWAAMRAAVRRETAAGAVLGPDERLTPEQALRLFTNAPHDPGGPSRTIEAGAEADLCLLQVPWTVAREELTVDLVGATVRAGELLYAAVEL